MAREHHLSEQNKERYPAGWAANSVVADPKVVRAVYDKDAVNDYRLQDGSPAIGAGIVLPDEYEDPLRPAHGKRPDIGALPFGGEQLQVGINGRISAGMVRRKRRKKARCGSSATTRAPARRRARLRFPA